MVRSEEGLFLARELFHKIVNSEQESVPIQDYVHLYARKCKKNRHNVRGIVIFASAPFELWGYLEKHTFRTRLPPDWSEKRFLSVASRIHDEVMHAIRLANARKKFSDWVDTLPQRLREDAEAWWEARGVKTVYSLLNRETMSLIKKWIEERLQVTV